MSGKEIIVSSFVSIMAVSLIGIVGLPMLYPMLQTTQTTTPQEDIDVDLGSVLQSKFLKVSTLAGITDDNIGSFMKVPNTELNITISANSRISAMFTSPYIFGVGPGITNKRFAFNVSLVIENVGNESIILSSWNAGSTTDYYEYSSTMFIQFVSGKLSAGTYTINVKYKSAYMDPGLAYLTLCTSKINQTRSLWVQELR